MSARIFHIVNMTSELFVAFYVRLSTRYVLAEQTRLTFGVGRRLDDIAMKLVND